MISLDLAVSRSVSCLCSDTVYPQDAQALAEYIGVIGAAAIRILFCTQTITGRSFSKYRNDIGDVFRKDDHGDEHIARGVI